MSLNLSYSKIFDIFSSIIQEIIEEKNRVIYYEMKLYKEKLYSLNETHYSIYINLLEQSKNKIKKLIKELNHLYADLFNKELNELNYLDAFKFVINYIEEVYYNKDIPTDFLINLIVLRKFILDNWNALGPKQNN